MRFGITAALAAATIILGGASASAADLPLKAPPMMMALYNWTGFYAGLNVGYGWGRATNTASIGVITGTNSQNIDGIIGGGQIGYNWQMNRLVLGIEADLQASDQDSTITGVNFGTAFSNRQSIDYFGTVRGRVGVAFDRWLPYVTGGWAYGKVKGSTTITGLGVFNGTGSYGTWVLGAGIEAALNERWTAKIEYLHFGRDTVSNSWPTLLGTLNAVSRVRNDVLRMGVNYRF